MPLNIDLNLPCNDTQVIDLNSCPAHEDIAPCMELDCPSLTPSGVFLIDLNACPPHGEPHLSENEVEDVLSIENIDNNIDDFLLNEADSMLNGIPHEAEDESDEVEESDIFTESVQNEIQPIQNKRSFLDNNQRKIVSQILIKSSRNGKLYPGTAKRLASTFSVSTDAIYRIWRQIKTTGDACHKKTKTCGRKMIEIDFKKVREIEANKRSNMRGLASALGIGRTKLTKYLREGALRRHSNALKPYMTHDNKKARLRFCLSMLEQSRILHDPMFKSMHNVMHIDEKWFYMTKKTIHYYLLADEDEPYRTCKNKNFIVKVMFLVVVARPRFDDNGNETFSGKIGVFPLVNRVPAIRSSVNRASGTLETKPIASITKEASRMFLINKVIPAIKEKWPREHAPETIYIQHDNALTHISIDDEEFRRAASEEGFDICLTCQPPNSPDLNVLDLGFFSAIQSLQQKELTTSIDQLIEAVQKSYDNFSSTDSEKKISYTSIMYD